MLFRLATVDLWETGQTSIDEIEQFIIDVKAKHDEYFRPATIGAWSTHPNEHFFIKKFGNDTSMTGRQLRLEEEEEFQSRYSSTAPDWHFHMRDYHRLCNGKKIQFDDGKPTFQGYCQLKTFEDPWLYLAPAKVVVNHKRFFM